MYVGENEVKGQGEESADTASDPAVAKVAQEKADKPSGIPLFFTLSAAWGAWKLWQISRGK